MSILTQRGAYLEQQMLIQGYDNRNNEVAADEFIPSIKLNFQSANNDGLVLKLKKTSEESEGRLNQSKTTKCNT